MAFSFMDGDGGDLSPFFKIIFDLDILRDKNDSFF